MLFGRTSNHKGCGQQEKMHFRILAGNSNYYLSQLIYVRALLVGLHESQSFFDDCFDVTVVFVFNLSLLKSKKSSTRLREMVTLITFNR